MPGANLPLASLDKLGRWPSAAGPGRVMWENDPTGRLRYQAPGRSPMPEDAWTKREDEEKSWLQKSACTSSLVSWG